MAIRPILSLDNKAGWQGNTSLILDHVHAGFAVWSSILAGQSDVRVHVELSNLGSSGSSKILASASINQFSFVGYDNGLLTYESPIATELKTGQIQNSYATEVTIRIDAASLSNGVYFIDPSPLTSRSASGISGSQYDLLSVVVHEIAHTLGLTGWRSAGGTLSGSSQSVFDSMTTQINGQLVFQGENVFQVLGTYPVLDNQSIYHFQADGLLDPYAERGQRILPSRLDAALFADLGIGTIYDDRLETQWGRTLDTGAGHDRVTLEASKTDLFIRGTGQSDFITGLGQPVTLLNAETLILRDAQVTLPESGHAVRFDVNGDGGYAYRLYKAALDRQPDPVGLGGWIDYLDKGGDRKFVANGFANSNEFLVKYGSLDSLGYVQQLYRNVLGRDGEGAGIQGWVNALNQGYSRAHVLEGFAEAPENYAITKPFTDDGIHYREWSLV